MNAQNSQLDSLKALIKDTPDDSTKALRYTYLWNEYFKAKPDSAIYIAEKGIALSKHLDYKKGLAYNYHNKGVSFTHSFNLDSCVYYYKKSEVIAAELGDSSLLGLIKLNTGNVYLREESYTQAKQYFLEFLEISKRIKNTRNEAFANNSIGNSLFYLEKYNEALGHFLRARDLFLEIDHPMGIAKVYNNLGLLYLNYDDQFEKAIENFEKGLVINQKNGFRREAALNLNNIGICYNKLKQYDKALVKLKQSLEIYSAIKNNMGIVYNSIAHGNSLIGLKQYGAAINYFNGALERMPENNKEERVKALKGVAVCHDELGKSDVAQAFYIEALEFAKPEYMVTARLELLEKLVDHSFREKEFEIAFLYQTDMIELQDSISEARNREVLEELRLKYEVSEIERENTDLELLAARKDIELARQRTQIGLVLIFLLFSVILSISWYRRFKDKKKAVEVLAQKNKTIEDNNQILRQQGTSLKKSLVEKDLLLKEVHHRVKNNLQIISSFFNIQEREKGELDIKTFVENGQLKHQSMSLAHDILYASERLDRIELQTYLKNLSKAIDLSFRGNRSEVEYTVDAQEIYLDINTTMTLGLILSELIYNSLKYAFVKTVDNKIWITVKEITPENFQLLVADNGVGVSNGQPFTMGLGLELIELLSRQLRGGLAMDGKNGTTATVNFKSNSYE